MGQQLLALIQGHVPKRFNEFAGVFCGFRRRWRVLGSSGQRHAEPPLKNNYPYSCMNLRPHAMLNALRLAVPSSSGNRVPGKAVRISVPGRRLELGFEPDRPLDFPAAALSVGSIPSKYQDFPGLLAARAGMARLTRLKGFYQCPARPRPYPRNLARFPASAS